MSFKFNNGTLSIRKVDIDENALNVNIMEDLQQSYRKYLMETVLSDFKYFEEELRTYKGFADVSVVAKVGKLEQYKYNRTQVKQGNAYYPVEVSFYRSGQLVSKLPNMLRIPYMDDYGKLNMEGKNKVIISVQRSAEDISYNMKEGLFNIAMPYANVRIISSSKNMKMCYGKNRINMADIAVAMLYDAGDTKSLGDYIVNTIAVNALKINKNISARSKSDSMHKQTDLLDKLQSEQYKLGNTREALNEALSIDRAEGYILSRDLLSYKQGTSITKAMISEFKRNRINEIYVKSSDIPSGYMLASPVPKVFVEIPAGTLNCNILRNKFPQYASEISIPVDLELNVNDAIYIPNDRPLTKDEVELMVNLGILSISVKASKTAKPITINFEREIVGNYTARLRELTTNIPAGRHADEWVYFFNNPNLEKSNPENLTAHDIVAIISTVGNILLTGKSTLLDRDTSFLKKVLMVNEIFSETLRATMKDTIKKYHNSLGDAINNQQKLYNCPLTYLTTNWYSEMNKQRFLAQVETVNLASEVSQVNHINTEVMDSSSVKDEQRHLAMPFYGRICPYETPAGKKLGIVNTKAIGTKIENGLMKAPYHKVKRTSRGVSISKAITWLSVKEELDYKFGDILSLEFEDERNAEGELVVKNTNILAKVPNPVASDEPFIFRNIKAHDLASGKGGYVSVYPEQFLSPTAALIPFACSDNPVRISFGLSQIKQSVYLHNSEVPLVTTPMYEKIFQYSDRVTYSSPCVGRVVSIDNEKAVIVDDKGENHTVYIQLNNIMSTEDTILNVIATVGERVDVGTVLAEAHKYPQSFVTRAPFKCRVVKITTEAITISRNLMPQRKGSINLENDLSIPISNNRIMGQSAIFTNVRVSEGDIVEKDGILADTCVSRGGIYSPSRQPLVAYVSNGYNYEDGICATELASINYTSMIVHGKEHVVSKRNYPSINSSLSQGFNYCGPNSVIATLKMSKGPDSEAREMKVTASRKEHGIPFETATIEDNRHSRTYKYYLLGFNKLQAGDKMSGRHGNKGVVSKVLKDSEAYQLLNGKTVEFVLNPCGVPSRMNLGQIYDAEAGLIATVLGIRIDVNAFNGATVDNLTMLMHYTYDLANTTAIGPIGGPYNKAAFDAVCSKAEYKSLPKELHEYVWNNINNIVDWRGVFDEKGEAELYDPETDTMFDGRVTIGYPTFFKLMQEADEKINARSGPLDEQYARTSSQPQKAFDSAKGQRMGEMELMAYAAMGCSAIIDEVINEKSDNSGRRINNHLKQLGIDPILNPESCTARSVESLLYMLEACGVKVDLNDYQQAQSQSDFVADISRRASYNKETVNLQTVIRRNFDPKDKITSQSEMTDFDSFYGGSSS